SHHYCVYVTFSPELSCCLLHLHPSLFSFNDPATTYIYTLSLHDALPILLLDFLRLKASYDRHAWHLRPLLLVHEVLARRHLRVRSEEHTSELQSLAYLVCRLLLEKKKKNIK